MKDMSHRKLIISGAIRLGLFNSLVEVGSMVALHAGFCGNKQYGSITRLSLFYTNKATTAFDFFILFHPHGCLEMKLVITFLFSNLP